jgi:very-short-patch-repair endonuclease
MRRKGFDGAAVWAAIDRHPRRKGSKALRPLIAAVDPQTRRTRSDLEVHFLAFCRRHNIEAPTANGKIDDIEVDMHWPGSMLVVELDDYEYHRTPAEFENDRRRDARLKRLGYTVIRVTGTWLDEDPEELAALLRMHVGVDRVL